MVAAGAVEGPIEGDLDGATAAGDRIFPFGAEVERLAAEGVVGLVGGDRQDVEDLRLGGAFVVAHGEDDLRLFAGRGAYDSEVDARGREGAAGDRVGRRPVGAADFAGGWIHCFAGEVVVDRDFGGAVDEPPAEPFVVAHPVDADGRRLGRRDRAVAADLERDRFAEVDAGLRGEAAEFGAVFFAAAPGRGPGLALVLVDDRDRIRAGDFGLRLVMAEASEEEKQAEPKSHRDRAARAHQAGTGPLWA